MVCDDHGLVCCTIKLLTMINSNKDCREKLLSANITIVRKLMIFDYVHTECMDS